MFINDNESAYLYQADATALGGRRLRGRAVRADLSGYTAELLAKAVSAAALDHGLTMKDVVYVRAYLVPDKTLPGAGIDIAGWNAAYGAVFGTAENPTKTARSTVGVVALVNPDWLIELEAFAVFP